MDTETLATLRLLCPYLYDLEAWLKLNGCSESFRQFLSNRFMSSVSTLTCDYDAEYPGEDLKMTLNLVPEPIVQSFSDLLNLEKSLGSQVLTSLVFDDFIYWIFERPQITHYPWGTFKRTGIFEISITPNFPKEDFEPLEKATVISKWGQPVDPEKA